MTRRSSADVGFLLIDGYDVMGVTTDLTDNIEASIEEVLALGETWPDNVYVGVKRADLAQEGYFDDASDSINDALKDQSGVIRVVCYGLEGNTVGQHFIGFEGAMQVNYNRLATKGQLHRANANYNASGQVDEGEILHTHTARTADGDTELTPVTVSAQTTDGGIAYLQVSALNLDGATDVTITVLHSTDAVTWETLTTFTAVTEAPAVERKTLTGTVKKNLAVSYEFTGGADDDSSVKFMVGFVRL
jgi:hypothetical protein